MGNGSSSLRIELLKALLESPIPFVREETNKLILNRIANTIEPRPRPISMAAPYTTWAGLTDRTISGRQLPPSDSGYTESLPPIQDVLKLFKREKEQLDNRTTLLFPMFAQWFVDSFLRTKWKPAEEQDFKNNESNHEGGLDQIYGANEEITRKLRSMEGGRLKSQMIDGELFPEFLFDPETLTVKPEFEGIYTEVNFKRVYDRASDEHKRNAFAVGLEHGNSTVGNTIMNVLFLREHNRVAGVIAASHPNWDDERVFQTTRNVLIVIMIRIVFSDYIKHIAGGLSVFLDNNFAEEERWYRQNWISVEFNLLYRWHDLIPSKVQFGGETRDGSALRQNNRWILELGVDNVIRGATNQKAGKLGLGNTPDFLLPVRELSLTMSRKINLQPYVKYCEEYGLDIPESFEDVTGDRVMAQKLRDLYGSVDRLEWFVGLFAQKRDTWDFSGDLLVIMVAHDAVTQLLTSPLLARRVYNARSFSKEGLEIIESTNTLADVALRNTGLTDPADVSLGVRS